MKTIYEIPAQGEMPQNPARLIEISETGMTLCWTSKEGSQIDGIAVYGFEDGEPLIKQLNAVIEKHPSQTTSPETVKVYFNTPHTILVPNEHYHEGQQAQMLTLLFGSQQQYVMYADEVIEKGIHHIYSVSETIDQTLRVAFPQAAFAHSNTKLIQQTQKGNQLQCVVFYDMVKFILYKNDSLQLIQQYPFNTPEDVVYHALNACQQFELLPDQTSLLLSGMIVADSQLYKQLYNYFIDIQFDHIPNQMTLATSLQEFPTHFFSHLTKLVS